MNMGASGGAEVKVDAQKARERLEAAQKAEAAIDADRLARARALKKVEVATEDVKCLQEEFNLSRVDALNALRAQGFAAGGKASLDATRRQLVGAI